MFASLPFGVLWPVIFGVFRLLPFACCAAQDLLALGADVNRTSSSGRTAVQMAESSGSAQIRELLAEHMAAARRRPDRECENDG